MEFSEGSISHTISFYNIIIDITKVFGLAVIVEWLSHTKFVNNKFKNNNVIAGIIHTLMYGIRMAMAYLVMLSVMSYRVYIFIAAIAGFAIGFLIFGSRVLESSKLQEGSGFDKVSDLPPLNC